MKNTAYEKLGLRINGLDIHLGMVLDTSNLRNNKFKKPGFFSGINKQPGQTIYWSKNCVIQCFNDKFSLLPNLDTSSGADMMFGTSAYLYFVKKSVEKITFQLVGNAFAADWIVRKFQEPATDLLGQPTNQSDGLYWIIEDSYVILEKREGSKHAHFHWIKSHVESIID